ncbi:MAG: alanyl-tRNA editing protein [Clostridiales bacterium]|jgi:alanyl-tRNA synthetase|nr:alanyl-tRNA editing protein [Clostridiales bacterium]
METEKLFYTDAYQKAFEAKVVSCEKSSDGYALELNRTCFYPEGGGQPADKGTLEAETGKVQVLDVKEKDGRILHLTDKPIEPDMLAKGEISWPWRFQLMQSHSGEHIVSGVIKALFKLDNVGFHMGTDFVTIDTSGPLTEEQAYRVEAEANRAIWENRKVICRFPPEEELRDMAYRAKKAISGAVRIVEITGADLCACCGLHVANAGEIGIVKIVGLQKWKSGVRISMLAGNMAYLDYAKKCKAVAEIGTLLSSKQDDAVGAVKRLMEQISGLKEQIYQINRREDERKAASIPQGQKLAFFFEDNMAPDDLRLLSLALAKRAVVAAAFSKAGEGHKYALASLSVDARKIAAEMNAALNGRGGGKSELVQGSVAADRESIEKFLEKCN